MKSKPVRTHSGVIGNEGADACTRTAALTDTTDIALPDARDPFHNSYWFSFSPHTDATVTHITPTLL
eukprot:1158927-Pelagomonas_calceolata.AAC.10